MTLSYELDPAVSPALRDDVLTLWADVSNAGGSVGFVPPVTADEIRPELVKHLVAMAEGRTRLLVGRDGTGAVAATAFLTYNTHRLMKHWVWLYTVMVHPRHQGKGYGRGHLAAPPPPPPGAPRPQAPTRPPPGGGGRGARDTGAGAHR
ncbi:GNAT family N-acetyltransferase, partial [Streptomyces diastatochromogenes]|uniref:GNAT family N-acetyltransferase n=1 Tax=Streptomyces diastatochromogenes TaxID=42236 RepID=UPI0036AE91EC